jgi:carboxyl-terminal processing protease
VAYAAAVEAGSAAAVAGLTAGDIVSRVGGRPTRQMPLWAINHELAQAARATATGGHLELEIVRDGETRAIRLAGPPPAPAVARLEEAGGFPMLVLPRIDAGAVETTRTLLGSLATREPKKLIVDLRALAGGEPEAAYALAGLFASGELGALRETKATSPSRSFRAEAAPAWTGEILVLQDQHTAGAAEILGATLRQSAGAKLVGVPSFGWAGERSRLELSGGARLLLTTAYFSAADGKPISEALAPDLLVDDAGRHFEERDRPLSERILDKALKYLAGETELAEEKAA